MSSLQFCFEWLSSHPPPPFPAFLWYPTEKHHCVVKEAGFLQGDLYVTAVLHPHALRALLSAWRSVTISPLFWHMRHDVMLSAVGFLWEFPFWFSSVFSVLHLQPYFQ